MNIAVLFLELTHHIAEHLIVHKFWEFVEEQQHQHIKDGYTANSTPKKDFYDYFFPGQNFIIISNPDYDKKRKVMLEILSYIEKENCVPRYTFFHSREMVLLLCEKYDCLYLVEDYLKEEREDIR